MKASSEHVMLWGVLEGVMNWILLSACVSVWSFVLVAFLRSMMPIPVSSGSPIALVAISILLSGVSMILRNDFAACVATRFDFVMLYYCRIAMRVALVFAFILFFLASALLILLSQSPYVLYALLVGGLGYLAFYPVLMYTDFFSHQGEAYLFLTQALVASDLDTFNFWLRRGTNAMSSRLRGMGVHVSGKEIFFAVNLKLLKGELVRDTLAKMADDIMRMSPTVNASPGLYDRIVSLTNLTKQASADGLTSMPSYRERVSRTWDFLARSSQMIAFLAAFVVLMLVYLLTGKLSLEKLVP